MPDRALATGLGRLSLRAQTRWLFALPVLALVALGAGLVSFAQDADRHQREIERLQESRFLTAALVQHLVQGESAVRGYRLTGGADQVPLEPYFTALREAPRLVRELEARAAGSPQIAEHAQALDGLVERRLASLADLRRMPPSVVAGDPAVVRQAAVARDLTERIRAELDHMVADQRQLESLRAEQLAHVNRLRAGLGLGLPLVLLIAFGMIQWLIRRVLRHLDLAGENVLHLVEGGAIQPLPEDGGEARQLNAALARACALLRSRERESAAARAEAERANHAKTAFLSRMSHELRTPLTAVLGFAELLDMDELTDDQRDSVRHIRGAGAHLLTLINEVLDISRIESGNLAVSIEPTDVGEVVGGALMLIRPIAEERGVRLPRRCGDGVLVRADRQRLTQVLLNLLSNAVKYNRQFGEIRLACSVTDDTVRIAVADTGMGIAPELLPRVFLPFDRLGAEQTGVEGTGVGLVLSKGLVEAMGGGLTLESVPGVGTTFTIELPLAHEHTAPPPTLPAPPPADGGPGADVAVAVAGRTVLYVEDNAANLDLVARFLRGIPGVQLITTMQGGLAMDLARMHRPDLVLLDLHLPDLDGESVLRRLRADPETAGLRVAMLTADATPGQERRLRAIGADDFLTKPLDFSRLAALLRPDAAVVRP